MEMEDSKRQQTSCTWLACCNKYLPMCSSKSSPPPSEDVFPDKHGTVLPTSKHTKRNPGGWKVMPFILGNETFERLATFGLLGNFMIFLLTQFHMEQASAANVLNIFFGVSNFAPLIGAFISDAYIGRFWTIGVASFGSLLGMAALTIVAWVPQLHPPRCTQHQPQLHQCDGPTTLQLCVLFLALGFLSIGTGGIRPCSLPFGVDQFDATTDDGRKGINSFFNWYYASFTVIVIVSITVVVYIQNSVSWVWGFGVPTMCMVGSIVLFFAGKRLYVHVKPEGSVFSGIAQALVAAYKKRRVKFPAAEGEEALGVLYDPPLQGTIVTKLPLTNEYRSLNKAAIVLDGEVNPDGSRVNPWTLCSIQQVEEVKCIIKIMPIWASGIICFTALIQQSTFTVSQAQKMDRHLGPKFQIPPGSLGVISMITLGLWILFYDRILVPVLRKITGHEGGITILQRMGIGMIFSVVSMVVAGVIEKMRRDSDLSHDGSNGVAPISVMWLAPQLMLMGLSEAFNVIGQLEFYNKEFPQNLSSVANALFSCTIAFASYLSSSIVTLIHGVTGGHGQPDWLTDNINAGKIDYFYYVVAGMGVVNLIYFLIVAKKYRYKIRIQNEEEKSGFDVERDTVK